MIILINKTLNDTVLYNEQIITRGQAFTFRNQKRLAQGKEEWLLGDDIEEQFFYIKK